MTSERKGTAELSATLSVEEKRAMLAKMLQKKAEEPRVYPLSLAQQRLWILDRMEPGNSRSNISRAFSLVGTLQPDLLEKAFQQLVNRHESLRTTFVEQEGQPVQVVSPSLAFQVTPVDLQQLPKAEREAVVRQSVAEEAKTPFDLEKGPLLRARLLQVEAEQFVLVLTIHHIITDGWSMGLLTRELSEAYNALAVGQKATFAKLPIQYGDFAKWQRNELQGESLAKQVIYWKKQLDGAQTVLDLPTDRPRPSVKSYQGAMYPFAFPKALADTLKVVAREEQVTFFMVLLAAFQTLLYRYSGQEDLLLGTPISGRNRAETEGLIGFFVNTLVLRGQMTEELTFAEWLQRTRATVLEAFANQDVAFEKLVEELEPERTTSHTPLVQVMFSLQNMAPVALHLQNVQMQAVEVVDRGVSNFDLTLELKDGEQGLQGWLQYDTDLFAEATAARMMRHFQTLLEAVAADRRVRLVDLPLLTMEEQLALSALGKGAATEYPRERSIHRVFEEQAAETPDAVAVICGERMLTYGELNRRANRVAHYLKGLDLGKQRLVGLFTERSPEMIVAMLGILKAGAGYLPLDPMYPQERLALMVEDAQVAVLLTEGSLAERLPDAVQQVRVVRLDVEGDRIAQCSDENVGADVTAEDLAYVIYTSGSTGRPKGVCVPHRGVVRLVKSTDYVSFSRDEVILQFAAVSFDAATFEIWGSLLNGARLVLYPGQQASLEELGDVIAKYRVSTMFLTTGLFHQMVEGHVEALQPVRQLVVGGDAMSAAHARRLLETWDGVLVNGYGPTENTTFSTFYAMTDPAQVGTNVLIGRPIANTDVYVLDRQGQQVPIGVPGELHLGGDGLAVGYLQRPELTAEKFVWRSGEKLYRTGDLVRFLPDGNLEFLGRIDNQVKIRGYRIELGEIENHLNAHPAVAESVVKVWEPTAGDKRLVAYVVADECSAVSAAEMRTYLQSKVPEFMVPSAFVFLAEMPLNRNGKVDRRALPAPGREDVSSEVEYVAPRTSLERRLADIWQAALRVERVGVHDHFFELGGHSMLAIQVLSKVRQTLGVGVPMHKLFEAPRIAELAPILEAAMQAEGVGAGLQREVELRLAGLPVSRLSYDQEELWNVEQVEPGLAVYCVNSYLSMKGPLDVAALERSLQAVVRRQEMLRTRFEVREGEPMMVVEADWTVELPVTDLSLLRVSEAERTEMARELRVAFGQRAFDLTAEPPFRVELLKLGAEEHQLLLNVHHLVTDGWSNEVLRRELALFYQAFANGEDGPSVTALAELPIQYGDYVRWQREYLQGGVLERLLQYWEQKLAGVPSVLNVPTDFPRPVKRTYRGAKFPLRLPEELVERLEAFCQREDVTMNMVLLAAFQLLLVRFSGQEDFVVGTPIVNRDRAELADLIGYLIGVLMMRADWQGNPSVREALGRVRETARGAYAHKELPIELLMRHLQPEIDPSRNALYQVMFVYFASVEGAGIPFAGLEVQGELVDSGTSEFELMLVFAQKGRGIEGRLEYNRDLFALPTVEWLVRQYVQLLEEMVRDPEQRVWEVRMLEREGQVFVK